MRYVERFKYTLNWLTNMQILDVDPEGEEDGANQDLDSMRKGKCAVIKTSTRQTVFLPLIGLVPAEKLKPGDLIGVNKDSYLVLDTLPAEFDSRVKAMEVDERPTETYTDIGGLEKQIEELVEAIVLPMEQADKFKTLGIKPPKGCLMYGPPGMWPDALDRRFNLIRLQVLGRPSSLVPALLRPTLATSNLLVHHWCRCSLVTVRSWSGTLSNLPKRRPPLSSSSTNWMLLVPSDSTLRKAVIAKFNERCWSSLTSLTDLAATNELRFLFPSSFISFVLITSMSNFQVIAATNRIDILDPALLRSGRLDRKIEFPLPNETARARILEIHSRKMSVSSDVNFEELARSTDEFNGAQLKAVCVEAGMIALREGATKLGHEHFLSGIAEGEPPSFLVPRSRLCAAQWTILIRLRLLRHTVQSKKKNALIYFA